MNNEKLRKILGIKPSLEKIVAQTLEGHDEESLATFYRFEGTGRILTVDDGVYMDLCDNLESAGYELDNQYTKPFYEIRIKESK